MFSVPETAATDPEEATTTVHGEPTPTDDVRDDHGRVAGRRRRGRRRRADPLPRVRRLGHGFPQGDCGEDDPIDCFSAEYWRDLVLAGSDTAVAVISAVPVVGAADPLSIDAMERGRALAAELCGDDRVLIQGHAVPDVGPLDAALASMAEVAAAHSLCAWKVYTHAPGGWFLDDHDPGVAADRRAVPAGGPRHGRPGRRRAQGPVGREPVRLAGRHRAGRRRQPRPARSSCTTRATRAASPRAPYDPDGGGVDRLVRSVADAGIGPGGNVYAELGSTWRTVMGSPDEAAHVLGKLLVAFGPERILWGTDSIWYGSPQDQIAAFRAFEITPAFQERFGYPALTPDVKRRILGAQRHRPVRHHAAGRRRARRRRAGGVRGAQPHARPGLAPRHRRHVPARAPVDRVDAERSRDA